MSTENRSASVKLTGETAKWFDYHKEHMIVIQPGTNPSNSEVLRNMMFVADRANRVVPESIGDEGTGD